MPRALSPATVVVTAGRPPRVPDAPLNAPITAASTFHAGGPVGYGRFGNPGWGALEEAVGALEGGTAVAFASGMAAVDAVVGAVPLGGVAVVPRHSYSGTLGLLDRLEAAGRLSVRRVDLTSPDEVAASCTGADLLWLENPTNPALEVCDVAALAAAARQRGAVVAVDNTFATPLLQRPLALGADVVVHAATKALGGHSDALLGLAVVPRERPEAAARLVQHRTDHGGVPGALEAFLVLRGLRTLHLRLRQSQASAVELVRRLAEHPAVGSVRYPGFGAVVSVVVRGGAEAAERVAAGVRVWVHATSLGGVESTLERRRRWAGEAPTIPEGLLRLSVGVEDVEDLWDDLAAALSRSAG